MAWSCGYTPRAQILRTLIDVDVVVENRELALLNYCSRHLSFTHSSRLLLLLVEWPLRLLTALATGAVATVRAVGAIGLVGVSRECSTSVSILKLAVRIQGPSHYTTRLSNRPNDVLLQDRHIRGSRLAQNILLLNATAVRVHDNWLDYSVLFTADLSIDVRHRILEFPALKLNTVWWLFIVFM